MIASAIGTALPLMLPLVAAMLLALAFRLYWPHIAGWLGERCIRNTLAGLTEGGDYGVLHDLLLPCDDGRTTQIDHIVCTPSGIFVIETKNYAGWIYGKAGDAQWIQSLNRYSKFRFQNPILQNVRHVNAVRRIVSGVPVRNVVVFVNGHFPNGRPDGVFATAELEHFIRSFAGEANRSDPAALQQKLHAAALKSPDARRAHLQRLQKEYGGAWRIPVAHSLSALALVAFLFSPSGEKPLSGNSATQPQPRIAIPPRPADTPSSQTQIRTRTANATVSPIQVIAMSKNRAAIIEDGEIVTLKPGQLSPRGWQLASASSRHASLISPDGRRYTYGTPPDEGE